MAEIKQRGFLAPFLEYDDGTVGMGVPGLLYQPYQALARLMQSGYNPGWDERTKAGAIEDAFDAAGLAVAGSLAAPRPRGSVGMGGRPTQGEGIRAYHGSPHDFDRFDMSKIGTGEGNQAYGHGLYFAEREGVARSYRDKLTDGGGYVLTSADGTTQVLRPGTNEVSAAYAVDMSGGDFDKAIRQYTGDGPLTPIIRKWQADGARVGSQVDTGHIYEVRINANPNDFLDWDKPLSEQSEKVRQALASENIPPIRSMLGGMRGKSYADETVQPYFTGSDLVSELGRNDSAASQVLRDAGIPGIRYLDQGSRAAGEGSRNYVVFDDALIEILRKYGLLGALGLGAASQVEGDG